MAISNMNGGHAFRRMTSVALAAEMVYQLVGSNMSSPQTGELNARARAPTIQKWINITNAEAVAWIVFLTILDSENGKISPWPAIGGGLALGGMVLKYRYAIQSGLNSPAPATENYERF